MIIDKILDRYDGEPEGEVYRPEDFYRDMVLYGGSGEDIARAMDFGTEEDVRRELCKYIVGNDYNPEICEYINSRCWLSA